MLERTVTDQAKAKRRRTFLAVAVALVLGMPLHATVTRYKVGSTADAALACRGPAYDIGGGGGDVDPAIQWLIDQVRGATGSGGTKLDVVILRCSGSNGYNAPILAMNGVNSVETIVGTSVADFNDPSVARSVANAEVIFFAGGNQANYVQFIMGTAADPLVLELRGPASPRVKGAAFFLDLGAASQAAWARLGSNTYHADPGNLNLGAEPRLRKDKLIGGELQVGIFQKTGDADPGLGVLRIALALNPAQPAGDIVLTQARNKAVVLQADGSSLTPLTISLGALKAE